MTEWIATEWQLKEQFETMEISNEITIHRMISPFYDGERFAVKHGRLCLNIKGKWECESQPSSRTDKFYDRCRFKSFEEAKKMAEKNIGSWK